MAYKFDNDRPIYLQLVEIIKADITSGKLKQGDKLLSVREYAEVFKVNPNTMQKALQDLEEEGLIYTERTNGKYVINNNKLINKLKEERALELVTTFIKNMNDIGIGNDEIIKYMKKKGIK